MNNFEEILHKLRRMSENTASDAAAAKVEILEAQRMLRNLREMLDGTTRDYADKVIERYDRVWDAVIKASETANETMGYVNDVYDEL